MILSMRNKKIQKSIFSYSYLLPEERSRDSKLPDQKDFFDIFRQKGVSNERAKKVWDVFECTTLENTLTFIFILMVCVS